MRNSIGVRIPAGAPKNIPSPFGGGIFFPAAPGESKFIPVRGNPRWSTKKYSLAFWRGNFFPAAPGSRSLSPLGEIPAGAPKNIPSPFGGGIFFPAAPGESKFIPDRGNPRWSTKKSPRLLARRFFSGCSRGVEVYPRQGKSPLEHQKSFISKGWTFHRARDKIE